MSCIADFVKFINLEFMWSGRLFTHLHHVAKIPAMGLEKHVAGKAHQEVDCGKAGSFVTELCEIVWRSQAFFVEEVREVVLDGLDC